MKRAIKTCSLLLVAFCLVMLATCDNPAGGGDNKEGEFTISLGNGSAGKAVYPPDWPDPGVTNPGGPLIEELRFEITFTPVAVGKGEKREFKFDGDDPIGGSVKEGTYTVTMDVYEINDDSYLYAHGSAERSPIEIKSGKTTNIKVLLYDAHNAHIPAISVQPSDTTLIQGGTGTLTIGVLPPTDTGSLASLSYQWYSNTTPSNSGGTPLDAPGDITNGSQTETFSPDTATLGTYYYYVIVTNTNPSVLGNPTTDAISDVATVEVILSLGFVEVIDITDLPSTATLGNFTLSGTVDPATASNQIITWSIQNAGTTGATIAPGTSTLNTTAAGTVTVKATVANGLALGDFTKDFTITVNALTWTTVSGNPLGTSNINGIAFGDGRFVAAGNGSAWTDDGVSWTSVLISGTFYGAAWGDNMFILGGNGGSIRYLESNIIGVVETSPGITKPSGLNQQVGNIFHANNMFIIGNGYGGIWYLEDGTFSWMQATLPVGFIPGTNGCCACAYGSGMFVTVCDKGKMLYSSDGIIWTEVSTTTFGTSNIRNIAYGNGSFVAVGLSGKMAYSIDGINWTAVPNSGTASGPFGTNNIEGIAFGNGLFVAGGASGKIAYSSDGINWISQDGTASTFGASNIQRIAYGNGRFVAVGASGKIAYCDWP